MRNQVENLAQILIEPAPLFALTCERYLDGLP